MFNFTVNSNYINATPNKVAEAKLAIDAGEAIELRP